MSDKKKLEEMLTRKYRAMFAKTDWHGVKLYHTFLTSFYNINSAVLKRIIRDKMQDEIERRGG